MNLKQAALRFLSDEEGATAIEYGLIAGLISVVLIGVFTDVGTQLKAVFQGILDVLPKK